MEKTRFLTSFIFLLVILFFGAPKSFAAYCDTLKINLAETPSKNVAEHDVGSIKLRFSSQMAAGNYSFRVNDPMIGVGNFTVNNAGDIPAEEFVIDEPKAYSMEGLLRASKAILLDGPHGTCTLHTYTLSSKKTCTLHWHQAGQEGFPNAACVDAAEKIEVWITDATINGEPMNFGFAQRKFNVYVGEGPKQELRVDNGETNHITISVPSAESGSFKITAKYCDYFAMSCDDVTCSSGASIKVVNGCTEEQRKEIDTSTVIPEPAAFALCEIIPPGRDPNDNCGTCVAKGSVWTGIGCIPTNTKGFATALFTLALGLAGGLALLLILYGSLLILISSGDPEQTQKGKQVITGAVTGLLFIIFSVVILNIIGVQILNIPGL